MHPALYYALYFFVMLLLTRWLRESSLICPFSFLLYSPMLFLSPSLFCSIWNYLAFSGCFLSKASKQDATYIYDLPLEESKVSITSKLNSQCFLEITSLQYCSVNRKISRDNLYLKKKRILKSNSSVVSV